MPKVVVNSTPIISLSIIDQLDLLKKLYNEIYIPQAVYDEARQFFSASLHKGEVEVMVLARELEADLLIIDEKRSKTSCRYI